RWSRSTPWTPTRAPGTTRPTTSRRSGTGAGGVAGAGDGGRREGRRRRLAGFAAGFCGHSHRRPPRREEFVRMRRLLAVAALGALAGCGSKPAPPAAGPPTPTPAARSSATADPFAANTQVVCSSINGVVKEGTARFATDLGAMVGHLAGGNQPEADKSRKSAQGHLTELGAKAERK